MQNTENNINTNISLNEVREKFLNHMKDSCHAIIPSSRLIPDNDPTTLFTGSGMQPMVPYLLGASHPLGKRIADSQKCFRSQDIEEVGDNRHTTFFEMLGNWSLGDYFKKGQIDMMWDFIINKIKLDPNRIYFSVYKGNTDLNISHDDEAIKYWQEKFESLNIKASVGFNPELDGMKDYEKIFAYDDKKNWWSRSGVPANMPVGEPGGPDTEMFYDFDPSNKIHEESIYKNDKCHPNCDCGRFVEFGNNVFMQYRKTSDGVEELSQKNVDFGGGLERFVAVLANDPDVFNIDAFENAKNKLEEISGQKYISDIAVTFTDITNPTFAYRVILDHVRAATFLIADGVLPGNKDQQYFVRRLIRRSVRYARNLNINNNFTKDIAKTFIDYYKDAYTELLPNADKILEELDKEESKFRKTLESGMKEFEKIFNKNTSIISGEDAFNLLQTFGFPVELTEELAKEKGVTVDMDSFRKLKEEHAAASRTASSGMFKGGLADTEEVTTALHSATHIMLAGMRKVLGDEVHQAGSNINSERLRFDVTFNRKIEEEEIKKIEDYVNDSIQNGFITTLEDMDKNKAKADGVEGSFWDKYPDIVKVYTMKNENTGEIYSRELCGGPHVENSDDYLKSKTFKIAKQESVSAGVRRVKAVLE